MYVAPSGIAAGFGLALAERYPKYARRAKLLGLFADRWVPAGARLEYRGSLRPATTSRGPYTLVLADGSAIEPEAACLARYANFAREREDANAEFVESGGRAYLVATRAIAPHAEILTHMPHEPPARPARDAVLAYKHLERAEEHSDVQKKAQHEARAKWYARRALSKIGEANEAAFGARTKQTVRKIKGGRAMPRDPCHVQISRMLFARGGIPDIGNWSGTGSILQCLFVTTYSAAGALREPYNALKLQCAQGNATKETTAAFHRALMFDLETPLNSEDKHLYDAMKRKRHLHAVLLLRVLLSRCGPCGQLRSNEYNVNCPFEYQVVKTVTKKYDTKSDVSKSQVASRVLLAHADSGPTLESVLRERFTAQDNGKKQDDSGEYAQETDDKIAFLPEVLCVELAEKNTCLFPFDLDMGKYTQQRDRTMFELAAVVSYEEDEGEDENENDNENEFGADENENDNENEDEDVSYEEDEGEDENENDNENEDEDEEGHGHYVASVRHAGSWWRFDDDEKVRMLAISPNTTVQDAVLLFYQRK